MSQQPEQFSDDWKWPECPGLPILDSRLDQLSKFVLEETATAFHTSFGGFHQFHADEGWYVAMHGNVVYEVLRDVQDNYPVLSIGAIVAQQPGKDIVIREHEVLTLGEGRPPRLELVREFRRFRSPLFTGNTEGCVFEKVIEEAPHMVVQRFLDYNLPSPNILASWKRPMIKTGSVSDLMEIRGQSSAPLWWERDSVPPICHITQRADSPIADALMFVEAVYTEIDNAKPEDIIDI